MIPSQRTKSPIQFHRLEKTPTTILYDQGGNVLKIGEPFIGDPEMIHHFKSDFLTRNSSSKKLRKKTEELISDYLRHFCGDLLQRFCEAENIMKDELEGKWYLTTPSY